MPYQMLATDYDGTLATDGQVTAQTLAALELWQGAGHQLVLITGRQLDDLRTVFSRFELFDWVVAENGAVLYSPSLNTKILLAKSPPQEFVHALSDRISQSERSSQLMSEEFERLRNLAPVSAGQVIVATWTPHDVTATMLIEEMGLNLDVILNKGAVMILPKGIDKATGLEAAIAKLNIPLEQVVGVGDAENDLAFLTQCGYSVAVNNALPTVKDQVDWVTNGDRGAGVEELIQHLLSQSSTVS